MENNKHYIHLEQLFGKLTDSEFEQILSFGIKQKLQTGSYLFDEVDEDSAMYILLAGRLRVVKNIETEPQILGDIAAGSAVGEFAFFTKEKRSASVYAIRNSEILKIDEEAYKSVVKIIPQIAFELPRIIIDRLRQTNESNNLGAAPKNIALLKLNPNFKADTIYKNMQDAFLDVGIKTILFKEENKAMLHQNLFFEHLEENENVNLIECSSLDEAWTNQCLLYCELIVLIADFSDSPDIYEIEINSQLHKFPLYKTMLLLAHSKATEKIYNTKAWLQNRRVDLHLHVRENNARDMRRFCRIVSNQAVGLTLGGGGAKGAAHVGAVKALMEAGLEFDFIGGTSAGALYGMGLTITDFNFEKVFEFCELGVKKRVTSRDYHFPFLSLMTGKNMKSFLEAMLEDAHLEDFLIQTFCVSTNYSNASSMMHNTGLARKKAEGSIAIPGIFPPVLIDGHLHIDGGVLDNLPVMAMHTKPVRHVIAISLSPQTPYSEEIHEVPSAWKLFINLFKWKNKNKIPKLPSILINSLTLNNARRRDTIEAQTDMFIEMDLRDYGLLEWDKWREISEKGYQFTKDYLEQLPKEKVFWNKKGD